MSTGTSRGSPFAYVAIALSAVAVFSMSYIHSAQRSEISRADRVLSTIRLARVDLNRGFLRTLPLGAESFDRDEGLAILRQAGQTIAEADRRYSSGGGGRTRASFAEVESSFASLMARLEADGRGGERDAELRIAFYGIERNAELLDETIQAELRSSLGALDGRYVAVLWAASLILIVVTAATHAAAVGRARVEGSLRESRELVRSIIENAPSLVYAFDAEGRCVLANRQAADFLGVEAQSMIGRSRGEWMDRQTERTHRLNDGIVMDGKAPITVEESISASGGEKVFLTTKFPIFGPGGEARAVVGISTDITDRKRAERELRDALGEREVLLRELNHRTKNNMQVISSWLALRSARSEDPAVVAALRDADAQVKAMALVHRKLYQGGDLSSVDLADYLRELVGVLLAAYGDGRLRVRTVLDFRELRTVIDAAVPCGLIVSELVSNTIKHGVGASGEGTIRMSLERDPEGNVRLAYADDGPGLPASDREPEARGIGLATVRAIGEGQLSGRVGLGFSGGFTFSLVFSDRGFRARV